MKTIKKERKKSNMSFNFCQYVDGNTPYRGFARQPYWMAGQ